MSSAEDFFGSSGPADFDAAAAAFGAEDTDLMAEFWHETDRPLTGLFATIHDQIQHIKTNYSFGNRTSWQSFHRMVDTESGTNVWIVNRVHPAAEFVHILSCWEGVRSLRYREYVVSPKTERSHSARGEAIKRPEEDWSEELLGKCALVEFSNLQVSLLRGSENEMLRPVKSNKPASQLGGHQGPTHKARRELARLEKARQMQDELTGVSKLLESVSSGAYYEFGAEGKFE